MSSSSFETSFFLFVFMRLTCVSAWKTLSARASNAGAKNGGKKSDFSLFLARQNFLRTRSSEPARRLVIQ